MKGKDFIITSLQSWNLSIGSNAKDIAKEISKDNRVLYLEPVSSRNYKLTEVQSNLWVLEVPVKKLPINFLPDGFLFDIVNKYNQKRVVKYFDRAIKKLKFQNYILFIDNDIYNSFYLPELLSPIKSIYYRRDRMVSAYWKKHAPRLEPLIVSKCHGVVANSLELAKGVSLYNKNIEDVGQGVDLSAYSIDFNYECPQDILNIKRPIIGYTGMITSLRLDADLIYDVAFKLPEYSFVMVGKEDEAFQNHKLHTLTNVHFLGAKKPELMPNYIFQFDVCINPQLINDITIGNYPRKVDEYLALGKPVVATKTDTMVNVFSDFTFLAISPIEYVMSIGKAIDTTINDVDLKMNRIKFANSHDWSESVIRIYNAINKF